MTIQNSDLASAAGGFSTKTPHEIAGQTHIFTGAVGVNSAGYLVNAGNVASFRFQGLSTEEVDNTAGENGVKSTFVQNRKGLAVIEFDAVNPVQTWIGAKLYFYDNHTVAKTNPGSGAVAGYGIKINTPGASGKILVDVTELA